MANKFTKSVLERQYLEKKRTAATEEALGGVAPAGVPGGRAEKDTPINLGGVAPAGIPGSRAERDTPVNLESTGRGGEAVPAHILPEPEGRTETASQPAAGIDEAFERADGGVAPAGIPGGRAEKDTPINLGGQRPLESRIEQGETGGAINREFTGRMAEVAEKQGGMANHMSDLVESYLIRTPERVAKNKTFYLDEAVINGIRSSAKKQKVTESKLVNDILRGVLGIH